MNKTKWTKGNVTLYHGDCLDVIPTLSTTFDTVLTDPPYSLGFMGQPWDKIMPGKAFWTAFLSVCKPGANLLAFGSPRTFHRLASAIEDGGWDLRDTLCWLYGSGFPHGINISKAIDKAQGLTGEVVGRKPKGWGGLHNNKNCNDDQWGKIGQEYPEGQPITAPAGPQAASFNGWHSTLKPSWEPILLAQRPLDGSYANNAVTHGVAGLNVDGSRTASGRWPTNVVLDEATALALDEQSGQSKSNKKTRRSAKRGGQSGLGGLGDQGTVTCYGDSGGASRFFYCAKCSPSERGEGNSHPCVKPVKLLEWLATLTKTPLGGSVLDPFMGSGSTGLACIATGRPFTGIEKDKHYFDVAVGRIKKAMAGDR
jgi:DNA modification methylase